MSTDTKALGATNAIYQKHGFQLTAMVKVTGCLPFAALDEELKPLFKTGSETDHIVATDETIFYAQGGGQPADAGFMKSGTTTFTVKGVRKAPSGTIFHLGSFDGEPFPNGSSVNQSVHEETRILHNKIHDAGHIVSSGIRRLASIIPNIIELKAQHYPEASFVEFKGLIEGKHKAAIEEAANQIVQEDLPITVCWWTQEELKEKCWSVPEGLSLPEGELARAVDIEGAGAYPCGGTHMRTTGEVGAIVVRKIVRQKGVSKISYALK